jgi:hypothetical protein
MKPGDVVSVPWFGGRVPGIMKSSSNEVTCHVAVPLFVPRYLNWLIGIRRSLHASPSRYIIGALCDMPTVGGSRDRGRGWSSHN